MARRQRLCVLCRKNPVWRGGDVAEPGPVCKRCYHQHVWPDRPEVRRLRAPKQRVFGPQHALYPPFCERLQAILIQAGGCRHRSTLGRTLEALKAVGFNQANAEAMRNYLRACGSACDCRLVFEALDTGEAD